MKLDAMRILGQIGLSVYVESKCIEIYCQMGSFILYEIMGLIIYMGHTNNSQVK